MTLESGLVGMTSLYMAVKPKLQNQIQCFFGNNKKRSQTFNFLFHQNIINFDC